MRAPWFHAEFFCIFFVRAERGTNTNEHKKLKIILMFLAVTCFLVSCSQTTQSTIIGRTPPEPFGSLLDNRLAFDYVYYEMKCEDGIGSIEISAEKMENGVQVFEKVISSQTNVTKENLNSLSYNYDVETGKITSFNFEGGDAITLFELNGSYELSDKRFYNALGSSDNKLETGEKFPLMYLAFDKDSADEKSAEIMDDAEKYDELYIFYISVERIASN